SPRCPLPFHQISLKPLDGKGRHLLEGARLLEEVARAGDDYQLLDACEPGESLAVEFDDDIVLSTHDQQGRLADPGQDRAGEVRTAATGDNGANPFGTIRSGDQGCGRAR